MASLTPLSFLRPIALPRPSTIRQFLFPVQRFLSTSSSTTSTSSTTTSSFKPTVTPVDPISTASSRLYRVNRTPSNQLPIYHLAKRGGNMKLTRIRKIDGDLAALREDLQAALGVEEKEVVINQLTRQIIVKGHKRLQVERFFTERGM